MVTHVREERVLLGVGQPRRCLLRKRVGRFISDSWMFCWTDAPCRIALIFF